MNRITMFLLLCLTLLLFSTRAAAAERPYHARGAAHFISPTEFVGSGNATHLGHYSERGTVAFSPTGNPAVLNVVGSIVYTAANGNELHAAIIGELNLATGVVTAGVTYVGGTGRFASASGSSNLAGQMLPDGTISVAVVGSVGY